MWGTWQRLDFTLPVHSPCGVPFAYRLPKCPSKAQTSNKEEWKWKRDRAKQEAVPQ